MDLMQVKGRLRYVVVFGAALIVACLLALALASILRYERGSSVNIDEHRHFNQMDHDSLCRMQQDEARAEGRPVHPCGSESHR